ILLAGTLNVTLRLIYCPAPEHTPVDEAKVKKLEPAGKSASDRRTGMLAAFLVLAGLLAPASPATAQSYPTRPVRFIVPIAPGGGGDLTTRAVAQKLQALWGQNVVVDNRAGGTGTIGLETTA